MNRVAAIQKSSRTITIAWTCSPSHCRSAATSSVFGLVPPGEEPLLELVEDQQHLLARAQDPPAPQRRQRIDQVQSGGQVGAGLAQAPQQPGLGLLGRRLDVDRQHVLAQPGQQPRLDQRRLAAARRAVDQADAERRVGVGRLDPGLPEPEALGQAVAVARAGQQLEEEVGVVLVERPQPLGDDLDGPAVGVGPPGVVGTGVASWVETGGGADRARGGAAAAPERRVGLEEVPQVVGHVAGRAVPLRRPLGQRLLADPLQLAGDRVVDLAERPRLGGGDLVHHLGARVAAERPAAGQQLVEDDAQAEDVRAAVDPVPLAPGLLGAHVGGRPGEPGSLAVVLVLQRQPEVGHAGLPWSVDQDVRGLDVAVDQAPGVGVVQRLGDGRHQLGRLAERRPALPQPLGQVAPLDVLRDDVAEPVVGPAHVVDRDDVRVVEPGEGAGLGQVGLDVPGPATRSGFGTLIATGRSSSSSWAR